MPITSYRRTKGMQYIFDFIKEFSWDEMAVSLDINPHSCMNLVARAVAKLQRMVVGEKKK